MDDNNMSCCGAFCPSASLHGSVRDPSVANICPGGRY